MKPYKAREDRFESKMLSCVSEKENKMERKAEKGGVAMRDCICWLVCSL